MANVSGIRTVEVNENQLADFMTHKILFCGYPFVVNEYLVLKFNNELIGPYRFNGDLFIEVPYQQFASAQFGTIKPRDKDPYQMAYMDSLDRNQLTFCTGPAGSGKT